MFLASQAERVYLNFHFYKRCTALSRLARRIRVACMLGIWGWIAFTQVVLMQRLGALRTPLRCLRICSLVQRNLAIAANTIYDIVFGQPGALIVGPDFDTASRWDESNGQLCLVKVK